MESGVFQHDHVFRKVLNERQEAPFSIVPGVSPQLLIIRLQRLYHSADPELIVPFAAIQSPDHQVHDAEMEHLFVRLCVCQFVFFFFNPPHQLLCVFILARHDITYTQISQNYSRHLQDVIDVLPNDGFIVADRLFELPFLHEEAVGHIEFPSVVFRTKLCGLSEEFLNLRVIFLVSINLSLSHQDRDILFKGVVIVFQSSFDSFVVSGQTGILNLLSQSPQLIHFLVGEVIELLISLFWSRLLQNQSVQVLEVVIGQTLVCQFSVLCQHIRR